MAYSVHADVQLACGGAARLLELADFDGDGVEDAGVVDGAIAEADAMINTYAKKLFEVPLATPTIVIQRLSARMAARILRRDRTQVLVSDVSDAEADTKWLQALAAGDVSLDVNPLPTKSSLQVDQAGDRSSTKSVSREKLKGFW